MSNPALHETNTKVKTTIILMSVVLLIGRNLAIFKRIDLNNSGFSKCYKNWSRIGLCASPIC